MNLGIGALSRWSQWTLFFCILLSTLFLCATGHAETDKPRVSFILQVDITSSLKDLRPGIVQTLAPLFAQALESDTCEIQVAIGNISYFKKPEISAKALGTPGFVNQKTENAVDLIRDRILNPINAAIKQADVVNSFDIMSDDELTYSSIANFVVANSDSLQDQDMVVSMLFTDAAPAFESMTPEEALETIRGEIGGAFFYPAIFANTYQDDMVLKGNDMACDPDFPNFEYGQGEGIGFDRKKINPGKWVSTDLYAIDKFTKVAMGERNEICGEDRLTQLKWFVTGALNLNSCLKIN